MKISTLLIYATMIIYANESFAHERKDWKTLQDLSKGSLKNIIINQEGPKIPELELLSIDSVSKIINSSPGEVTLINFWATWCVPCREEMPSLNKLIKSIDTENFSLVVIAAGRNSDKAIKKFFSEHNLDNLKSYKDPQGKVSSSINVFGLPTTIIIDQHQNELARFLGSTDWNSQEVIEFINAILRHDHPLYAE